MKLSVSKYGYITTRIRGMKASLIDEGGYSILLGCPDLEGLLSFLKTTPYGEDLSEIQPGAVRALSLEGAFLRNFFKTLSKIAEKASSDVASLILGYLKKFEAENLKVALRALKGGIDYEEALKYIVPIPRGLSAETYRDLLGVARDVESFVQFLEKTEYGALLASSMKGYLEKKNLIPLERALDFHVYGSLWAIMERLDRRDRVIAKKLIGAELEIRNIKILLRGKILRLDPSEVREYLYPVFLALTPENVDLALKAQDVEGAIRALMVQPYRDMLTKVLMEYEQRGSLAS
ncbi:V-type ATPase subunit, partial [Candidatus Bathyarchaeota archaeon]|nr:V-type ATPase subunit [Candidatus Bathyarchaeota archaeon]